MKKNDKYDTLNIVKEGGNKLNNNELKPRRWLLVVLLIIAIAIVVVLLNKLITDSNERKKNRSSNIITDIVDQQEETVNNMFDEFEINSFNSKFEFRVGENYGSSVKRALDDVITNNKKNQERLVLVVFEDISTTDPEEIKNTKKNFDDWTKYEISVDYDENGFVYKMTIEK